MVFCFIDNCTVHLLKQLNKDETEYVCQKNCFSKVKFCSNLINRLVWYLKGPKLVIQNMIWILDHVLSTVILLTDF